MKMSVQLEPTAVVKCALTQRAPTHALATLDLSWILTFNLALVYITVSI